MATLNTTSSHSSQLIEGRPGRGDPHLSVPCGPGCLYASTDYGATWQLVTLPQTVKHLICDIAFDPSAQGTVYFTSQLSGIYKSTDGGTSWTRIDDPKQPDVNFVCYRSADGGASWQRTQADQGAAQYLFAAGDSTRLYAATGQGLCFSADAGDSWTAAAGAFGQLQILCLADAQIGATRSSTPPPTAV